MLWKVQVLFEGKDLHSQLFPDGWNYFNFELDHWEINHPEHTYYYLPTECHSQLIRGASGEVIPLPYQPLSTARFKGNLFFPKHLVEVFEDFLLLTDLETLKSRTRKFKTEGRLESFVRVDHNQMDCLIVQKIAGTWQKVRERISLIDLS